MHDAVVVGGSFAGLAATLYLARGRHDVVVLDTGTPRNRFSPASHGFLSRDGAAPADVLRTARAQLKAYPTASLRDTEATEATHIAGGFHIKTASGETLDAKRLVLASGVRDILPQTPGLAELWGKSVIHCPYCHGYEFAGMRLGVLYAGEGSLHQAMLVAHWGPTMLLLDGAPMPDAAMLEQLAARNIAIETGRVASIEGQGAQLQLAVLADGRCLPLDALYVAPRTEIRGFLARQLDCALRETPGGSVIAVNDRFETSVPGVFAAGDIARFPWLAVAAAADGALAGASVSQSLIFPS